MFQFLKSLFLKPNLKPGDRFQDREWGRDYALLEVVQISKTGRECKYKFIRYQGDRGSGVIYSNACWYILSQYERAS